MSKFLYLIWKDPITRKNFIIGKLSRNGKYTFEYCKDFGEAEAYGWSKLEVFPEEKIYESEVLFPVFSSRLPDRKRRDIDKILEKYELSEFDEFELLRKSEGRLPIDTYSFVDPIFPENETIQRDFYIMGIRHNAPCKGEACELLPKVNVGDELYFEKEPQNEYDHNAIRIVTHNQELLGYVPRYYNLPIIERLNADMSYSCRIMDMNLSNNCTECIKVRLNMPKLDYLSDY